MLRLLITLLLALTCLDSVHAQRGYRTTSNGYVYRGRQYTLGIDGPVSSRCQCAMCRALRAALVQPAPQVVYTPKVLTVDEVYKAPIGTPPAKVKEMLEILSPKPNSVLLDPGCGDGRLLVEGARRFGTRGIGLEINPKTAAKTKSIIRDIGLEERINIYVRDSTTVSFSNADNIVLFLFPDIIKRLVPGFQSTRSGTQIISYMHPIPLPGSQQIGDFHLWIKP